MPVDKFTKCLRREIADPHRTVLLLNDLHLFPRSPQPLLHQETFDNATTQPSRFLLTHRLLWATFYILMPTYTGAFINLTMQCASRHQWPLLAHCVESTALQLFIIVICFGLLLLKIFRGLRNSLADRRQPIKPTTGRHCHRARRPKARRACRILPLRHFLPSQLGSPVAVASQPLHDTPRPPDIFSRCELPTPPLRSTTHRRL